MLNDLHHLLNDMIDVILNEADHNPEFAKALNKVFKESSVKGKQKSLSKKQAPDPFEVLITKGKEEFEAWLNELSIPELRSIVREQRFDPSRLSDKWKTKERFVRLIIERVSSRSKQGDVFRSYGMDHGPTTH